MTLKKIVLRKDSDDVALIFASDEMSDCFDFKRIQSAEIVCAEHPGYEIPVSAVRMLDGVCGVYILRGFVVEYREISPVFTTEGMIAANTGLTEKSGEYKLLEENDNIIVRGTGLYVGRIIK